MGADNIVGGQVGPATYADGVEQAIRLGRAGENIVQELHGRFYEQAFRGALFSTGMGLTAINNVTFTTGTLGATCTPILGLWNPANSPVNLVILQVALGLALTALQATGGGPFVWASSIANAAVSTGAAPWNRKSLQQAGSQAKAFNCAPALTGLTNNLVVMDGGDLSVGEPYSIASLATAAGFMTQAVPGLYNVDGGLIVPPGGVLALLASTTPVANSVAGRLMWEEVPV